MDYLGKEQKKYQLKYHMIKIITIVILKLLFALRCALFFIIIICKVQYKPIIIHSEKIMNIVSVLGWFPKETVKAFAFSPFAVLRFQKHEMNANWVNYDKAKLDTADFMKAAIKLYTDNGFIEIPAYRHNPPWFSV